MNRLHLHRPRLAAVAMTISLIGVFFLTTSAQAHVGGNVERILLVSTNPSEDAATTVLGWGPIHAKGTDRVISDTKDQFVFPRGSIFVTHKPQRSGDSFDPVTCTARFWEHGKYWVTGGTRAYAGAVGQGRYYVRVLGVSCSRSAPPDPFIVQIHAFGPLRF
jgi:hypothetical protein